MLPDFARSLNKPDPGVYPFLQIYPAAYDLTTGEPTHNVLASTDQRLSLTPTLKTAYPSFNLCAKYFSSMLQVNADIFVDPSVYPYLDIYPAPYGSNEICSTSSDIVEDIKQLHEPIAAAYPSFVLCMQLSFYHDHARLTKAIHIDPSVYPYFNLYPAPYFANNTFQGMTTTTRNTELGVVQFSSQYPIFNLCMCFKGISHRSS